MTESQATESHPAAADYAARRRERAKQRSGLTKSRAALLVALALGAVLVVAGVAEAALTAGRIHPRVSVAGVPVGGMTPENAGAALRMSLPARAAEPITVRHGESKWTVTSAQVGLDFDYDEQVAAAMDVGREGGIFASMGERAAAWMRGVDVPASPVADSAKMTVVLDSIGETTDAPAVNSTVKIEGTEPQVVKGSDGKGLDRAKASELILAAFTAPASKRSVQAPIGVLRMAVDEAAAERAVEVARKMLSAPVTVVHKDKSWEFSPEAIAKWLAFEPVTDPTSSAASGGQAATSLNVSVSPKLAAKPVTKALGAGIGRPAVDARFSTSDGRVTIIPSKDGIGPDIESLALALTEELKNGASDRRVELRTTRAKPKITTDEARAMGIKERISTYTTTFESSNVPRVTNIHLLGDALDGELIEPGGTFSFNGAAGERTAEKGYKEANAIVNGKLVPQLGGGVCQVGTTVFNAVFESGLPVIERKNHSFYISHYPKGRDATVSWGGPDLKFKNDTEQWVLVSVSYTNSSITVSLYGTDPGYEVKEEVGGWSNVRPFPVEEVKDPKLNEGLRVIEDSGVSGRSITVKRIVSKGGKVVRTDTFVSNYKPKSQVVRVGTKRSSSKPATLTP